MGAKITIDCATLMNKGLELIEAHHLFDTQWISLNVDTSSGRIHSMVGFVDGSVKRSSEPLTNEAAIQLR